MLGAPEKSFQAFPEGPALRVCTVSEGLDSVLRIAEYMSRIESRVIRTDLHLSEALTWLQSHGGDDFDLVLIAPEDRREAEPRMTQAVLDLATVKAATQVVLLPLKTRLKLDGGRNTRVIHGPPFLEIDAVTGVPTSPVERMEASALHAPAKAGAASFLRWPWRQRPRDDTRTAQVPPEHLKVMAFQSMAGGAGATTLAVNTAFGLAQGKPMLNVCLLDLNLQFGNVATYLDIPPSSKVLDAYRNLRKLDADAFQACLQAAGDRLAVFSAPGEILPFDALSGTEVQSLIALARASFDVVIIDLPHSVADWSGAVYSDCDRIHCVSTLDVRSAQNARKILALLRSEGLQVAKLFHVLNRAPARRNRRWKENCAVFEKGLGSAFGLQIVDGGAEVTAACDAGQPLAQFRASNAVVGAIRTYCASLRSLISQPERG